MPKQPKKMRILLTGASSFTGMHFAQTLCERGHRVVAALATQSLEEYSGIRSERLHNISSRVDLHANSFFGSEKFLELLEQFKPDIICHHAAEVRDYKNPDFDFIGATAKNTHNVQKVFQIAKMRSVKAIVLTCSVFEADMGLGNSPVRAFSPYGLSKTLTREVFRYFAQSTGLPLRLFAIPNPFGPYEEPRFVSYLVKTWQQGETPIVNTPLYLRDNIPVDLLSLAYAACVEDEKEELLAQYAPQGYVESQGAFAERVAKEFSKRIGFLYSVKLAEQKDFSEPLMRTNSDSARLQFPDWNEKRFWDTYVDFYRKQLSKLS